MFEISNVEFILLSLIYEQPKITGYRLNSLIDERGYREWADIGATSIYTGLKKLKTKECVTSATDRYKTGRGPKGVKYALTDAGVSLLKAETELGLSKAREQGGRFMLALSALIVLEPDVARNALERRIACLQQDHTRLQSKYEQQKAFMPFHVQLLFRYSFESILNEVAVTQKLLADLKQQSSLPE